MFLIALAFLLILSLLVLIHEFGHFIVAKRFGIKVEEFGFGFPPRIFGVRRGETIYSVNALPFGGFVKLYGEDEAGGGKFKVQSSKFKVEDMHRAFFARPPSQRMAVVIAGVIMNVALSVVVYYVFMFIANFKTEIPLLDNHKFFLVQQINKSEVIVGAVAKNSPAEKSGIVPYSKIVSVNSQEISGLEQFVATVSNNKGKEITITLKDLSKNRSYSVRSVPRVSAPPHEGALGVELSRFDSATLSYETAPQRLFSGFIHPANLFVYNMKIIGKLIGFSVEQKSVAPIGEGVTGPLGIFVVVGNILQIPEVRERILQVLNLVGLISLSLAFFNILPIPALDGGRLFFIITEVVTKKKISPKYESFAHAIAFAVLLSLIILVTIKDIPMFVKFVTGK